MQRASKVTTDPVKLARYHQVELMKMRHHAVPGNPADSLSIPQDRRLHVRMCLDEQAKSERVFWFRKETVTGKVLDCLASHVGMTSPDSSALQLFKVSPANQGMCALPNDQPIVNNVVDGDLLLVDHSNQKSSV